MLPPTAVYSVNSGSKLIEQQGRRGSTCTIKGNKIVHAPLWHNVRCGFHLFTWHLHHFVISSSSNSFGTKQCNAKLQCQHLFWTSNWCNYFCKKTSPPHDIFWPYQCSLLLFEFLQIDWIQSTKRCIFWKGALLVIWRSGILGHGQTSNSPCYVHYQAGECFSG